MNASVKSRGSLNVRWFRRAVPWGTVYLNCDERHPQRFKVGFTQRKTTERRKELARGLEKRLLTASPIPWAASPRPPPPREAPISGSRCTG